MPSLLGLRAARCLLTEAAVEGMANGIDIPGGED